MIEARIYLGDSLTLRCPFLLGRTAERVRLERIEAVAVAESGATVAPEISPDGSMEEAMITFPPAH